MQTKRYALIREATVASAGASRGEIINNSDRRANFHGIRWKGRIRADNASADNEAHGVLLLFCKPDMYPDLTESAFDSNNDLETASPVVIAIEPWSVFGGSTNPVGEGTHYDFNIVIDRTSRTCSKDEKIIGAIISYQESSKSVIVNHLLSCFETTL